MAFPTANVEHSSLVIIDIQQKLAAAMPETVRQQILHNVSILLKAADMLSVPVIVTEQYPKGLGLTESILADLFPEQTTLIEKTCFSAAAVDEFQQGLKQSGRQQVLLTGMEAHICVLQTALDLLEQNYEVMVIADAVCSRAEVHQHNALQRLRDVGAVITNIESVLFEWLQDARHPDFKSISKLIV